MDDLFLTFLEISVSVSLMIIILILITPFFNKRYASKWKYWIWIFLAIRLIIPVSGTAGRSIAGAMLQAGSRAASESEDDSIHDLSGQTAPLRRIVVEFPGQIAEPIEMPSLENNVRISLLDIIAFVWLTGCLLFIIIHLISYIHYKNQIMKNGSALGNTSISDQLCELKQKLHIKCPVRIIVYSRAASPMITGFLKPVLILPDEQYCSEELFFILKHELVHLKHRDMYVKLLFVAANAIHWFNPLVWIMQKEAAVDMELSCDESVTKGADYATRKAYTEALLSTLHKQHMKRNFLSTQFYTGKQIMKKRFQNILRKKRGKNGAVMLTAAAVLTIALGTLVGCSVEKESPEAISGQTEISSQKPETDFDFSDENGQKEALPDGELLPEDTSDQEASAENTMILTIMKEGEPEEKQATLVTGDGYSFYLPDGEWQKEEADMWQALVNENVHLWVARFAADYQIEQLLADDGYALEDGELTKLEEDILYKARLLEEGSDVWCVFFCYPMEAEEGWGRELPIIADTFAVNAHNKLP